MLPNVVCIDCWKMIETFHWFHEMVIIARREFLAEILGGEIKEEVDKSITGLFIFHLATRLSERKI